ncbi:hypothetical protein L3X38_011251 [Prunus dulcis]|uniref:Uncharacterized protein n=1 Tax=Prunus dulcis TaxID=3755 RepID=A0AAD4ZEW5_PRUDU|nr:hypothetical protein L3X38_011251 [Prunus dulcis]
MGEDMPIGLGGSFEYQGAIRRIKGGEAEGTDQSGEDSARKNQGGVTVAVVGSGGERREGGSPADQAEGEDQLEGRTIGTRALGSGGVMKPNVEIEHAEGGWSADEHSSTSSRS